MASDSELKVIIVLEDKASKGLKAIGSGLKSFGGKAGKIAAVGLTAAAAGLVAVGAGVVALARDAAPLQGLQEAFFGIAEAAGVGGDAMLSALQKGSAGMVTNRDLMMSFNKASQLVSVDFAQKLPDAMGFLGKVAQATGQDLGFMLDSLVTGVGRMSPMILDNLGIQISLTEAMDKAAEMAGKEASALSKTEQQAGLMAVVMEKLAVNTANMPDIAGSAEQAFASFGVMLSNTKDEIGLALLPAITPLIGKLGELASNWLPKIADAIGPVTEKIGDLAAIFFSTKDPIEGLKWALMSIFGPEIAVQFDSIIEKFTLIKDTILEFVNNTLLPFINEHWEAFKQGLIAVGAILAGAAILGGILSIVGAIIALVNPITLVIAGIVLLATAWSQNWGGIQEKTAVVVEWIKGAISVFLDAIQDFWVAHGKEIMLTVENLWWAIQSIVQSVTEIISTVIGAVLQFITEIWKKHGDDITKMIQMLWQTIVTVFNSAIKIIKNVFAAFANLLKGDWDALGKNLSAIWDALWLSIKSIFETAKQTLLTGFNVAKTILTNVWEQLKQALENVWAAAWQAIKGLFESAKTTLANIANTIVSRIKSAFEIDWRAVGRSIIDGIKNAITSGAGGLATAAKNAAKKAFNAFMNFLKGKSPSMLFATGGDSIIEGAILGINRLAPKLESTLAGVAKKARVAFDSGVGTIVRAPPTQQRRFAADDDPRAGGAGIGGAGRSATSVTIMGGITVIDPVGKEDFLEEISRLLV